MAHQGGYPDHMRRRQGGGDDKPEDYPRAGRPSTGGDARELPPRARRRYGWVLWLVLIIVVLGATHVVTYRTGVDDGIKQERAEVEASASVLAANKGPAEMQCPNRDSDAAAANAITAQPIVVIKDPPTAAQTLVMRKGVVVFVQATIAGDLIVCGNDAVVILEKPLSPLSGRLNIVGGHDKDRPGTGPVLYLVDDVEEPRVGEMLWFSNGHPLIIRCYRDTRKAPDRPRACGTYFRSAPVATSPSPSPSPSRSK